MNDVASGNVLLANEIRRVIGAIRETRQRVLIAEAIPIDGAPMDAAPADAEAVHDFRVALRRGRTLLRIGRIVWSSKQMTRFEDELGYYARMTGTLRDDEVLRALLASLPTAETTRDEIDQWLAQRAQRDNTKRKSILRIVRGGPSRREVKSKRGKTIRPLLVVLDRLDRVLNTEPTALWSVSELAMNAVGKSVQKVRLASAAEVHMSPQMHALRIREKRLRYMVEPFADVLGEQGARLAAHATRMQRRLGDLHDVDEAIATILQARGLQLATKRAILDALEQARIACAAKVEPQLLEARALELPVVSERNESLRSTPA
jgi:CHAD domain-containing protein